MAENKQVHPRLQPVTHQYLDDLVKAGTHGSNVTDVSRSLIEEGIRNAIANRIIPSRAKAGDD